MVIIRGENVSLASLAYMVSTFQKLITNLIFYSTDILKLYIHI